MTILRKPNTHLNVSKPNLTGNELAYVTDALQSGWVTMGQYVKRFEQRFAAWLGVKHAIACTSGTSALHLCLAASGVGAGDRVIVPSLTFVATSNAVRYVGADPLFVDSDPASWCVDLDEVGSLARLDRVKAIIPVHLYGMPCDMDYLFWIAGKYGLILIEDVAEGIGGEWNSHRLGTWGHLSAFSFYGNKTITTGEGGMVTTNDDDLADRVRSLRGHCMTQERYYHVGVGFNYRMTDVQAAIGVAQMERIDEFIARRHKVMLWYKKHLPINVRIQGEGYKPNGVHASWACAVRLPSGVDRDRLMRVMNELGVETRPVFVPNHLLPMYGGLDRDLPYASAIAEHGLILPTSPDMTLDDTLYVCYVLKQALEEVRGAL